MISLFKNEIYDFEVYVVRVCHTLFLYMYIFYFNFSLDYFFIWLRNVAYVTHLKNTIILPFKCTTISNFVIILYLKFRGSCDTCATWNTDGIFQNYRWGES